MKKKILLAEDESFLVQMFRAMLENGGYEVSHAPDGEEAIAMLQENEYDLLLLDLIMPKLNGFGVLEQIKEKKLTIPVIILSNLGQEEDLKKAESLGAEKYFIKSNISMEEVLKEVRDVIG